ncbi:hypothetical protein EI94DRAFT_1140138 [Lactarius quietus]|nr:hypothetical protein EI94DRAFT_1140138 [Lactarius quietus]
MPHGLAARTNPVGRSSSDPSTRCCTSVLGAHLALPQACAHRAASPPGREPSVARPLEGGSRCPTPFLRYPQGRLLQPITVRCNTFTGRSSSDSTPPRWRTTACSRHTSHARRPLRAEPHNGKATTCRRSVSEPRHGCYGPFAQDDARCNACSAVESETSSLRSVPDVRTSEPHVFFISYPHLVNFVAPYSLTPHRLFRHRRMSLPDLKTNIRASWRSPPLHPTTFLSFRNLSIPLTLGRLSIVPVNPYLLE